MANEEHLKILKQGVEVWNQWREENPEIAPDLSEANLVSMNLVGADLSGADLRWADLSGVILRKAILSEAGLSEVDFFMADLFEATLSGANLWRADLGAAELIGADFSRAYLRGASFRKANLSSANLSKADLVGADLWGAILCEADLRGATVGWTMLGDIDLSVVEGLDTVVHEGPSTIGIDTIYRSKGNIPGVFLQGAGIPDTFIAQIASLVEQTPQYYTCFISHSSKDKRFCDRLYADLRAQYVQAWYFPKSARWGETVWGEIDRSIERYDKVVVVCSENSLQSGPVLREIERALNREDQEGKSILFPIRIDNYIFDLWKHPRKADVVSKVVGDFRGWDQDAAKYEVAFKKLLRMLEAEGSD